MKFLNYIVILATLLVVFGCKKSDNRRKGSITIGVQAEPQAQLVATKTYVDPTTFTLEVWRGSTIVEKFAPIGSQSRTISLDAAAYTISAFSNQFTAAAFEKPVYGDTQMATIKEGENKNITLNCSQTNAGITITYSNEFKANHSSYSTKVEQPEGSLIFQQTETRRGYFLAKSVDMTILADGVEYKKTITLAPKTDYDIEVEYTPQTDTKSTISVTINVITTVSKEVIIIDFPSRPKPPVTPSAEIDYYETMGSSASNTIVAAYNDWSYPEATYSASAVTIRSDYPSDCVGASGDDSFYFAAGSQLTISGINSLNTSAPNVSLVFKCAKNGGDFNTSQFEISASSDGTSFNSLNYSRAEDSSWEEVTISGIPRTANLYLRFKSTAVRYYLDDIKLITQ